MRSLEESKEELVEALRDMKGNHFIVEGRKDVEALGLFGILNVRYLEGKGMHEFCEVLSDNVEYVILMDFDPEGERIAKRLREQMRNLGIKIDDNSRIKLRKLFIENNLNTIQGLRNLL